MSIFQSIFSDTFTLSQFLLAVLFSLILGIAVSFYYMFKNSYSKSLATALILLPAIEAVVIMMINDNFGAGIAVAGSFSLIRFRSAKGSAKDLICIFLAMTIGIICGTGYVGIACVFTVLICLAGTLLSLLNFGSFDNSIRYLKVTIPETLNYDHALEPVLDKYCSSYDLEKIKTLSLGSLFRLEYCICLKDTGRIKQLIDDLRVVNGNLEIMCAKEGESKEEL
ncbi:MAG: DUF4956 domain-containing protein [Erysipelotrichaceae bacterium]|nr:DUF4956 domain-containing protein [Erysipelotrichaceae bacterium]